MHYQYEHEQHKPDISDEIERSVPVQDVRNVEVTQSVQPENTQPVVKLTPETESQSQRTVSVPYTSMSQRMTIHVLPGDVTKTVVREIYYL